MQYTIYHNPRCSKSRQALQLLEEKGINPEVILYLKDVPSEKQLEDVLMKLNIKAEDLLRKNEAIYKEKFKGLSFNEHEWVKAMTEYPKLIERPIVIKDNKAIIARPPERILDLL